jgi:hypothetical protein
MSNPYQSPQPHEPTPKSPRQLPHSSSAWDRAVRISAVIMLGAAAFVLGLLAYFAIIWLFEPVPPRA